MSNIIGEPFDEEVKRQVETRQQKLGKIDRDQDILNWANSKTAFLRLASSIDLNPKTIERRKFS